MKVAIPIFNSRISPRFDCAQEMLLVAIDDGKITEQRKISLKNLSSIEKIKKILNLRVDSLICGGIDCQSMRQLSCRGLSIYAWLTGDVQDVISRFLSGKLESDVMSEPDGRRRGRGRFKRGKTFR
jgi:predicted Fe-Mo cluster-binding NifX family protein